MAVLDRIKSLTDKSSKELVSYGDELFTKARKERLRWEQQWYMNLAFYFGKQYVQWQGASPALGASANWSRLWEPPAPPWRVRLVSNRIRPIIRIELAKITKEKPIGFVVPATSDDDDLYAARAAEAIWEYQWLDKNMYHILRRAMFWTCLTGAGFIKDYWDKDKKDSNGVMGDICVEPVTPYHIVVPDLQEEDIEGQPYIVHFMTKDPDWVKSKFGKTVAPDSSQSGTLLEQKFLSALGIEEKAKQSVAIKEAWIKPCGKFPNGALLTWASGELLDIKEGEEAWYAHKQYPFTKFDHVPTGRFYADSVIPDLIPLQKEYNRTRSQIIEAKNRMAKPQLAAVRGSIDPNKITSEPGLIVFYQPGYPAPTPIPLQSVPGYVIEELDRSIRDMDDISGQHEITKGQTPPGVTAATAISFLQEADDSKLAYTVSSLEEGTEKIGRHFLSHVSQYWEQKRIVKVVGDNNQVEAFEFDRSNVRGSTDFRIQSGSATPRSKAAKQAFITEIGKMGWIPPDKALKYLDMAETGKLYEETQLDARQAQRENMRMMQGEPVEIHTYDNQQIHIDEHNAHRKRQSFDSTEESIQTIFEQHVQAHQNVLTAQAQGMQIPGIMAQMQPGIQNGNGQVPPEEPQGAPAEQGAI